MENSMEIKKTITINWWSEDEKEISTEERDILEERGMERAFEMMQQGYTSGELNEEEVNGGNDSNGRNFRGSFAVNTEVID